LNSRRNILVTNKKELNLERYKIYAEKCNGGLEINKMRKIEVTGTK
jgi:hypothetical protein